MADYKITGESKAFINPYNFVPLGKKCSDLKSKSDITKNMGTHTGYFICELKTKTPLAIPDLPDKDKKEEGHRTYPFMKLAGHPVIPASSLRGTIRSVYETLTDSCMVTMDPEEHITKRSSSNDAFKPCVIKKNASGKWEIYDAERVPLVCDGEITEYKYVKPPTGSSYKKYKVKMDSIGKCIFDDRGNKTYWGDEVDIGASYGPGHEKERIDRKTGIITAREVWGKKSVKSIIKQGSTDCFLYLGEMISRKHAESVFVLGIKLSITDSEIKEALDALEYTLKMYQDDAVNKNLKSQKKSELHFGYPGFRRIKDKGILPLWYNVQGGKLYLSLAAIGRVAYYNKMKDLTNGHEPCMDRKCLCPACSVFGMVGKGEDNKGFGSRVRFTDGLPAGDDEDYCVKNPITLKELGSPKPSYLKFYSVNGDGYDADGAQIRGRKYYWHNPKAATDSSIYSTEEKTDRNGSFELVEPEKTFIFKVYYDYLTDDQVQMLAWTITLGTEDNYMHKLGHGKSLGLGSVKISIVNQVERTFGDGYKCMKPDWLITITEGELPKLIDNNSWDKVKIICDYNKFLNNEEIRYPYVELSSTVTGEVTRQDRAGKKVKENVLAAHQWFKNNDKKLPFIDDSSNVMKSCVVTAFDTEKDFENKQQNNQQNNQIIVGQEYDGVVLRFDKNKRKAYIQLGGTENEISIYYTKVGGAKYGKIDKKLPIGKCVRVKYNGKIMGNNNREYDDWDLVSQ